MPTPRTRTPRVVVNVTEEIIAESTQRDSSHCMLAEAVKAAYPNAQRISVDLQTIRFSDPTKKMRFTYLTPRVAQVALVNYDQGNLPNPFAVVLRNGQVTRSGTSQERRDQPLSEAQRKQRQAALRNTPSGKGKLTNPKNPDGLVPGKIGGRTPPTTPFARRRSYGLRALEL